MPEFRTGLLALDIDDPREPRPPFCARGWRAWPSDKSDKGVVGAHEILISASSCPTAQRALDQVVAALYLVHGPMPMEVPRLLARGPGGPPVQRERRVAIGFALRACAIAARCSRKRSTAYALAKYKFSVTQFGIPIRDLAPYADGDFRPSPFPEDHVAFAHAIISAYSVLEELGLEIRASQQTPSTVNGDWNPVVLNELLGRLRDARINVGETLSWSLRGPRRRLEAAHELRVAGREPWYGGRVHDSTVKVFDAIAYSSWLRSAVASHKFRDLAALVSPYDVANVQHLARRLLLEVFGFWGA
jgi:hypothetical protein